MKKIFALIASFVMVLIGCDQSVDDNNANNNNATVQTITIKNESSFALENVKFLGLNFYASGVKDMPVSSHATQQITSELLNKSGYITFNLKDTPKAACRTSQFIIVNDLNFIFVFNNSTVVEELNDINNKRPLSQITFSRITVEKSGLSVIKNDIVPLGETIVNYVSQYEFSIKNTGAGKLKLIGNEPIKFSGSNDVFSIIQPVSSEINPNGTLTFKVNFNPKTIQSYSAKITIYSDDYNGDFSFTITTVSIASKPKVVISYGTSNIAQNGTINFGEEYITLTKYISIIIKNTGTEVLTIEPENITITGADATAFTKTSIPGSNISINSQTSFDIEFKPAKQGEHNAILRIPNNDTSRNPIEIYIKGIGKKGNAVLQLSQGNTNIQNNSTLPINFNNVDLGTNKSLEFTIKNTGVINLELTGEPVVESSNDVFYVSTQPANKTLKPGATTSFIIKYTPTAEIEDTASITISNNSDASVFTFNVKGTGYVKKPQITITQGSTTINQNGEFSFGIVNAGKTKEIVFTIKNTGDADLHFISVNNNQINLADNAAAHFTVTQQPLASMVIVQGGTTTFSLRFNPTLIVNNIFANVQIKTNSRNNDEFSFWVKGNCEGYKIGDTGPGGGLIFYAQGNQFKECSAELGSYSWSNAVTAARNYQGGSFINWHLPDKDELNLMYQNLHRNNKGGFTSSTSNVSSAYWSSTEYNSSNAWFQLFSNGSQYYTYTYNPATSSIDIIRNETLSGGTMSNRAPMLPTPITPTPAPTTTVSKTSSLRVRAVRAFSF